METVHSQGTAIADPGVPWVICRALLERERENYHTGGKEITDFTQFSFALCIHAVACTHIHSQVHVIINSVDLKRKIT